MEEEELKKLAQQAYNHRSEERDTKTLLSIVEKCSNNPLADQDFVNCIMQFHKSSIALEKIAQHESQRDAYVAIVMEVLNLEDRKTLEKKWELAIVTMDNPNLMQSLRGKGLMFSRAGMTNIKLFHKNLYNEFFEQGRRVTYHNM